MAILFIYIFIMSGIMLIFLGIAGVKSSSVQTRLPRQESGPAKKTKLLGYLFPFSQKWLDRFKLDAEIKNKLDAAHIKLMPREFLNLKLLIMSVLAIVTFLVVGQFTPLVFLVVLSLGYIIPDLWLNKKIAGRKAQIKHYLPETVDLLGLCIEAGLDFTSALRWIVEKKAFQNPMIEEMAFVLEEIKWGKPRAQALKDMSKRLNMREVSSFVRLLVQAERMGTPVAEAFGAISEDTRLQRYRESERFAMKAPIKILVPLIFFILPVIGIIVGGPILLNFMQGGLLEKLNSPNF